MVLRYKHLSHLAKGGRHFSGEGEIAFQTAFSAINNPLGQVRQADQEGQSGHIEARPAGVESPLPSGKIQSNVLGVRTHHQDIPDGFRYSSADLFPQVTPKCRILTKSGYEKKNPWNPGR